MTVREKVEKNEKLTLSQYACLSANTQGRERAETECEMRTAFQRDRDRIIHSKAFRRLKHKTQVFLSPEGDHYRTRLTHTLEVAQIARTIARALGLNEDLCEAVALGHDLGHTPYGHAGERVLDRIHPDGFAHYKQSRRVVEVLEKDHKGLNLTLEVRDGIEHHSGAGKAMTLEGRVVRLADKIAYTNHDIDDAVRGRIISANDIPKHLTEIFGDSHSKRITSMINAVVRASDGKNDVIFDTDLASSFSELRTFMFEAVYKNPVAKGEEGKAENIVEWLYNYYLCNPSKLPQDEAQYIDEYGLEVVVCDYVANMSDPYATGTFEALFVPKSWSIL
ncbi:MAG: deoxyguanosinetriphosphate triphosphohydrolase [Ruminococcaceae bacterium]|nr:deoxyguanosinetriphosphate triphosphohydrolase [Oscillospiraceae bacterium]